LRVLALGLLACACAGCAGLGWTAPRAPRVAPAPAGAYGRPADGLLDRADLQALVDAQVMRRPEALVAALGHADAAVRARAAFALGSVQDASAVPALLGVLADPDPRVRADAAFALGQSADSTSSLALVNALDRETDLTVVNELLDALGKTGVGPSLLAVVTMQLPAGADPARAMAIARYGMRGVTDGSAISWTVAHLRAGDVRVREGAAYALARARFPDRWRPHADAVRQAFDQPRPRDPARPFLANALGRLRDPADVARLSSALRSDASWRARVAAARALPALGAQAPAAWDALAGALDDTNDHVARTAADALAAADSLPAPVVTRLAAWVGAHRDRPLVASSLLPALARTGRAGAVLAWLDAAPRDGDAAATHRALAVTALRAADDGPSLDRLIALSRDADPRAAFAAIEALRGRWADSRDPQHARRFYDAFAAGLRRRDLATTTAAAPALADSLFRDFGAGALLREVYAQMEAPRDIEPMVEIIRAAGQVRDGQEVDFLVAIAMTGHPVLRQSADDALDDRLHEGIDVNATNPVPPTTILMEWDYLEDVGPRPLLVFDTERGEIVIEMDTEQAPQTVLKVARTAILRLYDDVPFHRVVPDFVVQGGDFFRRDGYGGPDVNLRSELTRMRYTTGTVGMASAGKDTEGVQYFITHGPTPHLDGRYTAFARVVSGQDVVDAIQPGEVVRRARVIRTRDR